MPTETKTPEEIVAEQTSPITPEQTAVQSEMQAAIGAPSKVDPNLTQEAFTGNVATELAKMQQGTTSPTSVTSTPAQNQLNQAQQEIEATKATLPGATPSQEFISLDGGMTFVPKTEENLIKQAQQEATKPYEDLQASRQRQLEAQREGIEAQTRQLLAGTEQQQKSSRAASAMQLARMGALGTSLSGVSYMQNLEASQQAELNNLVMKSRQLISEAESAFAEGNAALALEKSKAASVAKQEFLNRDKQRVEDLMKAAQYQKFQEDRLDSTMQKMVQAGFKPEDSYLQHLDKQTGLDPGTSKLTFSAMEKMFDLQKAESEKKSSVEMRKMALDTFNTLYSALDKIPAGTPVNFDGNTYFGTQGTGKVEVDDMGVGRFARVNQTTGAIDIVSLGKIGKEIDGWSTKEDDQGRLWRINDKTGQFLPMFPNEVQEQVQSVLPDGSVSPFKDASGRPRVQCGAFVNDMTGAGVGDSFGSKMSKTNPSIGFGEGKEEPQIGDFFVQKLGTETGHIGIVIGVEKDDTTGKTVVRALESNYPEKGRITSSRAVPVEQISGYGRTGKISPLLKAGPDAPTFGLKAKKEEPTPMSYREWELAGKEGTYSDWLKTSKAQAKPPTADETKNAGFAIRIESNLGTFDKLGNELSKVSTSQQLLQRKLPSMLKSPLFQQQEQAERDFLNAVLRRESGAAISPQEFDSGKLQYFPQPGDSKEVLEQKKNNRRLAFEGIVLSSGNALSEDFISRNKKIIDRSVNKTPSTRLLERMNMDSGLKDKVIRARGAGYSDEEIANKLGI